MEKGPEGPAHPLLPLRMCHNVSVPCRMTGEHGDLGMGAISRMQVVVRCERVFHLDLCTLERQSLCESHRQRRWLTCWSYLLLGKESIKITWKFLQVGLHSGRRP